MELAEKNGMFFIETSAKTADNINQLFEVCTSFLPLIYDRFSCPLHLLRSYYPFLSLLWNWRMEKW